LPARRYTAEEVDAAVARMSEPDRLEHAQEVVTHAAPGLARVLDAALAEGGWFGEAHEAQITATAAEPDDDERLRRVRTLVSEETRVGMLVGVAIGFQLAHELTRTSENEENT
jgi:hypothetical protein